MRNIEEAEFRIQAHASFAASEGLGQARWQDAVKPKHLAALDGLRGLAAFAVVYLHYCSKTGTTSVLPGAGLAVDFFFALSGYVLAHAYSFKLRDPE